MKSSRSLLLCIAAASAILLAATLYFQTAGEAAPCPLCLLQYGVLAALALTCAFCACLTARLHKPGAAIGLCITTAGVGVALRQLWIQAQPGANCEFDALLYKTIGLCTTPATFLGMSMAQWTLLGLAMIALGLLRYLVRREPLVPWLA